MRAKKIFRHILFYLFQLTWGLPLTIIGSFIALYMLITGHKPKKYGYFIMFVYKKPQSWGMEGGIFIFVTKDCEKDYRVIAHECGHNSYQQLFFGPIVPLLITIPSAIRFNYRRIIVAKGKKKTKELPPYDSIWFERTATNWGLRFVEKMKKQNILQGD